MVMDFGVSRDCELVGMERSQIGSVCVCVCGGVGVGGWAEVVGTTSRAPPTTDTKSEVTLISTWPLHCC